MDVFEAVKVAVPESPAWIIGVGMVHANAGNNPQAACAYMENQRISADSGDLLARAYLALFLVMADRRREAERVASAVVADSVDVHAISLAQALLDCELSATAHSLSLPVA